MTIHFARLHNELPSLVLLFLFLGIWLLAFLRFLIRWVHNRCAPVQTVRAVVIDKHKTELFSKYSSSGKRVKYVIVFSIDGRRTSFFVSEFSYGGYRLHETGMLTYKGDRILDFK